MASRYGPPLRPRSAWLPAAVLVFLLALLPRPALAQGPVGGMVVDATSRRPLAGAQVSVRGTGLGSITDNRGRFLILNVPGPTATLEVVLIGYRQATETVDVGDTDVRIVVQETALLLDELVVTGTAGAEQKRAIGNAIGVVDAARLEEIAPAPDIQAMISSQVPGVRIMDTGGEIGAGGIMRIRGASSMTLAATPIVVVDGVRVNGLDNESPGFAGVGADAQQAPSRINDFNPEDIERIEIIKGPAAATLYGTEASNGVIQIITKRGRQGAPRVNVAVRQGASWLPDPVNLFPPTYYRSSAGDIVEVRVLQEDLNRGLEWFRTGHNQSYQADVSGGTDNVTYYMSGNWERDEGPVDYNWQNKMSGRANVTYIPRSDFKVDFNIGAVRSRTQFASAQQPLTTAIIWSCPAPGCEPGSGLPNALDGPFRGYIAYLPEAYEDEIEGFQDVDRTTFGLSLQHDPWSWLNHSLTVGGDYGNNRSSELFRATGNLGNSSNQGRKDLLQVRNTFVTVDYRANGTYAPADALRLTSSGGVQFYQREQEILFGRGETFPVGALETISSGATRISEEDFLENRTFGVFFQEQLAWNDRLFLTGAVRGDDNSAFGQNFDFVVYPKVSASWVVSEEPALSDALSFLDALKLRAAWGKAGRQPEVFSALRTYEPTVGPGGASILTPENIGNPDLEPEVGEELELGFDASILDDRLGMEFTYYDQRTRNAVVQVPALPSLGFPGFQFQNIGEVKNSGYELALRGDVLRGPSVRLQLGFTFSTTENEVVDLGGQPPIVQSATFGQMHVEGFPLGSIFMPRVVSAELTDVGGRNVATNVMCEGGTTIPGTNFSRGGGAPVPCAEAPLVYWGQPIPEWEGSGSATLTLFDNLVLYGLADFLGGRTLISGDIAAQHRFFLNSREALERDDPILLGYETLGGSGIWQTGIIDGGFAKLRTLSANYTLPGAWADRLGASRLQLTVQADNVATLWVGQESAFGAKQADPEVSQQTGGATEGLSAFNQEGWPNLRRFTTTLRVTF